MNSCCGVFVSALLGFASLGIATTHSLGTSIDLSKKLARLKRIKLEADLRNLPESEKKVLSKLVEASQFLDPLYSRQVWAGNPELEETLKKDTSARGNQILLFFKQNQGPWSRLDEDQAFTDLAPKIKPEGAGFYPEDMTKQEFEAWTHTLTESEKQVALGFFSVIRRGADKKLRAVPYSEAYKDFLKPAAQLLQEASELTQDTGLKKYLSLRAKAFFTDDYYESDVAWMDLDSWIEPTIGPYETYEDALFNYKAAFESFITIKNKADTESLKKFSTYLQEIENQLPLDEKYKNKKLGATAPIRVVDQVFTAGEARRGIATAAFNLPNDERVIKEKGSKRVMLKNVQKAKFDSVLTPISKVALTQEAQRNVAFEPFFTHILMHELVHGLGPHQISVDGKATTVRMRLKDLYSAIEEAKADITGLFAMRLLMKKQVIDPQQMKSMYHTFLASCFRSVRFGINEAHGKGIALQFNYLRDRGAFVKSPNGTFSVDFSKIDSAVTSLAREILTLQAEGSYAKAKALLDRYAVIRPEMKQVLDRLAHVPVDIQPYYPLAGEKNL